MSLRTFVLRANAGVHYDENDRAYHAGDRIESSHDLVKMFPEKFDEIVPGQPVPASARAGAQTRRAPAEPLPPQSAPPLSLGADVSEDFPTAQKGGFQVFEIKGGFAVADEDNPTKQLNPKPLKRTEVVPFVKSLL